jgi:hypothetical protein
MRNCWPILILLAQAWCDVTWAGPPRKDERMFARFCADLNLAAKIRADGPGADDLLDECLFSSRKPLHACSQELETTEKNIATIRARRVYFTIAGSPMSQFYLWLSNRWLKDIEQGFVADYYAAVVRLRLGIEERSEKLRVKQYLDESRRLQQEGKPPLKNGGVPPQVEGSELIAAQIKYLTLIENVLRYTEHKPIVDCLRAEHEKFLPAYSQSPEGVLRLKLQQEANDLIAGVRKHLRLSNNWKSSSYPVDNLIGYELGGSLIGVMIVFNNDKQHKFRIGKDQRDTIHPWFWIALVDPAYHDDDPTHVPQPAEGQTSFYLGQNQRFKLFYSMATFPAFRNDSQALLEWLKASYELVP